MPEPITILISGALGTGKSTVSERATYFFREHLGETATLSTDEFYRMFDPRWTTNNRDWWKTAMQNCFAVATWLFQHGVQIVVIEGNGFYAKDSVDEVLCALGSHSTVYHITLDAQLDVVTERVRQRGDLERHGQEGLAAWLNLVHGHLADWTYVIDTSNLTPEETLVQIYEYIRESTGIQTRLSSEKR